MDEYTLEYMNKEIAREILLGKPDNEVLETMLDAYASDGAARADVAHAVADCSDALWAKQAQLAKPVDVERLAAAFDRLKQAGLFVGWDLARHRSDAHRKIEGHFASSTASERGYVFFIEQDLEGPATRAGGVLRLSYGANPQMDIDAEDIAREVVKVLDHHALDASWAGTSEHYIEVSMFWCVPRGPDDRMSRDALLRLAVADETSSS